MRSQFISLLVFGFSATGLFAEAPIGQTEILKWPDRKKSAISITYDDGTENQFKVALPIMQRLGLPATFFIITGEVRGSKYKPVYLGRPFDEILRETASVPTDEKTFYERSTAIKFSGYDSEIHTQVGEVFEEGGLREPYRLIDDAFKKIRNGELKSEPQEDPEGPMSWDDFRKIAELGYEFASHTISHPYLSVLDDQNLRYELEKSREEIREQLGDKHTFSVECPYGTENPRAVQEALKIYPLSRNLMPDAQVQDLNRWDDQDPSASQKAYVRWQRGTLTETPLELMKGWVDTSLRSDHVWLVLVFHGVDDIGWEPQPSDKLETYFKYIQSKGDAWVATFQDAGKYIREHLNARVSAEASDDSIDVTLTHDLDRKLYDFPVTVKTYVPKEWKQVAQGSAKSLDVHTDEKGSYVLYQAVPNAGTITLRNLN